MNLLQDLRFAARSLRARVGMTSFAVLTLATGLAATFAIWCVIEALLLRALPFPNSDQLVEIRERGADGRMMAMAYPNYADLASTGLFAQIAFHAAGTDTLSHAGVAKRAIVDNVGGDFFQILGRAPVLGRTFDASERAPVAVIAYGLWQGFLQGRSDVLGSTLEIGGVTHTVIGVMPADFAFPERTSVWIPMVGDLGTSRSAHNYEAFARLSTSKDLAQTRLVAETLVSRLKSEHGDQMDAVGFTLRPLADAIAAPFRQALLLLAAGTSFLLLIAISNTTHLLLALNAARARELAVRAALGASQLRLGVQVLLESLLVCVSASVLALLGAAFALRVLVRVAGDRLPRVNEIEVGWLMIAVALLTAIVIALIASAAVLWNSRQEPITELRANGRGLSPARSHLRARSALLIGQTALTAVLLIGAGLLGRSFIALLAIDPGFKTDGAVSVQLAQPWTRDAKAAAASARRYQELMRELATIPGVTAVGGVNSLPLTDTGSDGGFWEGSLSSLDSAQPAIGYAEFRVASADYFKAVGIPLLGGRVFDARDHADGEHVALISAAAARATWGDRDPIGQRIQYGNMDGDMRPLTIIGVVGDVHERRLDTAPTGAIYVNLEQRPIVAAEFSVVVSSNLPVETTIQSLRTPLERMASDIPHNVQSLQTLREAALADRQFSLMLFAAFSLIAFVLAVGGLYGLMAFAVGQRSHEFALRQALGSSRSRIAQLVLSSVLRIGVIGIAVGVVVALIGSHTARGMLYGIPASDPLTLGAVSILLLTTLLSAGLLPARRACAVTPRDVLV
jgi:putative ABC transport system permease protein